MESSSGNRLRLLLALMLLVTVLGAGTVVVSLTSQSRDTTEDLAEGAAPASLLLLNLDRDAYQAELYLERVVTRESAGLDATADREAHAENTFQLLGERWIRFVEIADRLEASLPGEAEHCEMLEIDRDIWLETAREVLDTQPGPARDTRLAQAKIEFDIAHDQIDVLEEEYWEPQIGMLGAATTDDMRTVAIAVVVTVIVVASFTVALTITNIAALRRQAREHSRRETELLDNTRRQSFETVLRRGLEMAQSETAALALVARATEHGLDRVETSELLLSNSSRSHLRSMIRHSPSGAPGCVVSGPSACRAVATGSVQIFADSEALDACPHLSGRDDECRTAVCVPVSINGRASGALHATRRVDEPFDEREQATRTAIANHTGIQLSVLRNQEMAAHQASTDPLTGLANRRSLEAAVHSMRERTDQFAILMIDLDHFKELNDTHGHETGDRALRVFADAAADVSADDSVVAARWGGEEFVIVSAGAGIEDGARLAEQLQEALALRLIDGSTPGFTVSIGVTSVPANRPLHEALELADQALYEAKEQGRNRVIVGVG